MKTLLMTGCFDILHLGHIKIINFASSIADKVVIALDSDSRVKMTKGNNRPFNNQNDRKEFLQSICGVNEVFIFNTDQELEELCNDIKPTFRLVGTDWEGKKIIGDSYCKNILYFDRYMDYSTTKILEANK